MTKTNIFKWPKSYGSFRVRGGGTPNGNKHKNIILEYLKLGFEIAKKGGETRGKIATSFFI